MFFFKFIKFCDKVYDCPFKVYVSGAHEGLKGTLNPLEQEL